MSPLYLFILLFSSVLLCHCPFCLPACLLLFDVLVGKKISSLHFSLRTLITYHARAYSRPLLAPLRLCCEQIIQSTSFNKALCLNTALFLCLKPPPADRNSRIPHRSVSLKSSSNIIKRCRNRPTKLYSLSHSYACCQPRHISSHCQRRSLLLALRILVH